MGPDGANTLIKSCQLCREPEGQLSGIEETAGDLDQSLALIETG